MAQPGWTRQALGLLGWLLVTFAAAAIGGAASATPEVIYTELIRPAWAPPASVFSPVWTVIYLSMAFAAWAVWRRAGFAGAPEALWLYLIQLVPNALWSWLFFGWDLGALAFADALLLWTLVICMTIAFWRASAAGGLLVLPYLLWVTYAVALNYTLWQINP